jgi:hypothetical protein
VQKDAAGEKMDGDADMSSDSLSAEDTDSLGEEDQSLSSLAARKLRDSLALAQAGGARPGMGPVHMRVTEAGLAPIPWTHLRLSI